MWGKSQMLGKYVVCSTGVGNTCVGELAALIWLKIIENGVKPKSINQSIYHIFSSHVDNMAERSRAVLPLYGYSETLNKNLLHKNADDFQIVLLKYSLIGLLSIRIIQAKLIGHKTVPKGGGLYCFIWVLWTLYIFSSDRMKPIFKSFGRNIPGLTLFANPSIHGQKT